MNRENRTPYNFIGMIEIANNGLANPEASGKSEVKYFLTLHSLLSCSHFLYFIGENSVLVINTETIFSTMGPS